MQTQRTTGQRAIALLLTLLLVLGMLPMSALAHDASADSGAPVVSGGAPVTTEPSEEPCEGPVSEESTNAPPPEYK